jgi:tetratricopeptide (TPR) repeat protein
MTGTAKYEGALERGLAAWRAGDPEAAYSLLSAHVAKAPEDAKALFALGTVCRAQERTDEAADRLARVVELVPDFAPGHFNLANTLADLGRFEPALDHYRHACALAPGQSDHWKNLAGALRALGRLEEALDAVERACALAPEDYGARWNRIQIRLLMGRFADAWSDYGARWRMDGLRMPYREFPAPAWDGAPLAGKTVLIWGEQGLGDELIFASLLPELAAEAGHLVVECERRLVPLFARALPEAEVVGRRDPPDPRLLAGDIDLHAPMGDVAAFRRRTRADFKPTRGYLSPDPVRRDACRARYDALDQRDDERLKVGVSWLSANPHYKASVDVPLGHWAPIFAVPGVRWINVQYGAHETELMPQLAEADAEIFLDTSFDAMADIDAWAAQIAACDLVISISNSTSCLAGALGVPVWQMLPFSPEAYWLAEGEETLWFASMRLFRQAAPGDWTAPVAAVAEALKKAAM